jgi:hypothetical protein
MATSNNCKAGRHVLQVSVEAGSRLAGRYRLEECLEQSDGAQIWRAIDEKLSRPVAIRLIPAGHARAVAVIQAARAAAGVDDGRFLRVLDAVEADGIVYVVNEWVPAARPLSELLRSGPLDPVDAQHIVTEAAQALAGAHKLGLAHLRIDPDTVLRTDAGQVKILGLCVDAALNGASAGDPTISDTRGLGRVLYAALTARWPEGEAYGLPAAPYEQGHLCTPRQVLAGVPAALDEVTDRILNPEPRHHATPLRTPGDVATALELLPRPRPGHLHRPRDVEQTITIGPPLPAPPAWEPSPAARTARVVVAAVLIAGLALLAWQVATNVVGITPGLGADDDPKPPAQLQTLQVTGADDFDPPPGNGEENSGRTNLAIDGDPSTEWRTVLYRGRADLGGLKDGVGLILDLGSVQSVQEVELDLLGEGTDLEIRAASGAVDSAPESLDDFEVVAKGADLGSEATLKLDERVRTRYLLVWLTSLPADAEQARQYRGGIAEVQVRG